MAIQHIKHNIYSVGVKDWNRTLFDELVPLPDGTTYNAYVIKGSEKTALIDSVDPDKTPEFLRHLEQLELSEIDYVVCNHAEQDHSGSIDKVLEIYPKAKVVTNDKCKGMLMDLLNLEADQFISIKDRETLSLGDKTLEFIFTPWVHWPETMSTWLHEDKILFSCDFFGSHFATSELFVNNDPKVIEDAKRYYAEIMMPFRQPIRKNIEKIENLGIELIAPSHGPIYNEPSIIIDAYKDWISERVDNTVIIPYVSMHGSTEKMVQFMIDTLIDKGIKVKPFLLPQTDLGKLAIALVDAATIIIATPTVLVGPHPSAVYAASLINILKPKVKYVSVIGSYGWGGKSVEMIKSNLNNLKCEFLPPVLSKGHPQEADFKALSQMCDDICTKHKQLNII